MTLTTTAEVWVAIAVNQRASSCAWPIVKPPPWKLIKRGCFVGLDVGEGMLELDLEYAGGV